VLQTCQVFATISKSVATTSTYCNANKINHNANHIMEILSSTCTYFINGGGRIYQLQWFSRKSQRKYSHGYIVHYCHEKWKLWQWNLCIATKFMSLQCIAWLKVQNLVLKLGWCGLARLQAPLVYNNGARKHRVVRNMQTSLNTRPKHRASAKAVV
jgi:hypothetical protein